MNSPTTHLKWATVILGSAATLWPAVRFEAGGPSFQGLGDFSGGFFSSAANDTPADGAVVVGRGTTASCNLLAFRWTVANGVVSVGDLPGVPCGSEGFAVSNDGSTVIGSSNSAASGVFPEALRWTQAGGMVGLGDLPGGALQSEAHAVSADGSVIVGGSGSANSLTRDEAFDWTAATAMVGFGDLPEEGPGPKFLEIDP
ncbi:MAG: hypothetical protein O7F76_07850 [Planctomycetota bacterium]|nr:hypothetical protein [Planctomycetota bacterium]